MSDLSIAVLVGRLTKNAELKFTNGGKAVCRFSIATSEKRKKGDQWTEEASFWDVDLWGAIAESLHTYLLKGKLVAVEGSMRQDRWENDGVKHMKVIVNANTVQLLGTKPAQESQQPSQPAQAQRQSPYNPDGSMRQQAQASADLDLDSVPF